MNETRENILKSLKSFFKEGVRAGEPLKKHCTFRIGGPAEFFAAVNSITNLPHALAFCIERNVPVTVIGWGSNILFPDEGIGGLVIKFVADNMRFDDEMVNVQAGALLPALAGTAATNGLSGLEFACGIPGTVGGAIVMNAGVKYECIGNLVEKISGFDIDGTKFMLGREQLIFGYRSSNLENGRRFITDVLLKLKRDDPAKIRKKMADFTEKRKETQPLEFPSAGSIFKNPADKVAWELIDKAGCRGLRVGDAQVSEKHTNFIVNLGNATYLDVKTLIEKVRSRVEKAFGVALELEIIDMTMK
jgi:UDP-N-acetylmuramate dehydrogenase